MNNKLEFCRLDYGCDAHGVCMLAQQVRNQALRGGWSDSEQNEPGGPFWDQDVWQNYCQRTKDMARNGCGDQSEVDQATEQAAPIFIR